MMDKILLVDDELLLLESLRRELGFRYDIDIAQSGAEGLEKIADSISPYAVIVSDYRMPKMDGIQFLTRVTEASPQTVRMMLTGNADLQTAIEAINQGQIFRFLTKPCSGDMLSQAFDAGLRLYQLEMAEKELLENTLVESVSMLGEMLAIVNPKAYGRSLRIQQLVVQIVKHLNLKDGWQYEMAASLSQLGWIIFPPRMLDKIEANEPLSAAEAVLYSKHPLTGSKLLERIPRLEPVARMIAGQDRSIDDLKLDPSDPKTFAIDFGSHMIKVCVDYDQLHMQSLSHDQILTRMRATPRLYHPEILTALEDLRSYKPAKGKFRVEEIKLDDLDVGMFLVEPVKDSLGDVLILGDTYVTRSLVIRLLSYGAHGERVVEPLKVLLKT